MKLKPIEQKLLSIIRVLGKKENTCTATLDDLSRMLKTDRSKTKSVATKLLVAGLVEYDDTTDITSVTEQGNANLLPKEELIKIHNEWKELKKGNTEMATTPNKTTKKAATKKAPTKKAAAKKAPTKKPAAKKTTKKAPVKKEAAEKKAPARRERKPMVEGEDGKKHRASSIVKNGITKPGAHTKMGAIWATIDALKGKKKKMPATADIVAQNKDKARSTVSVCIHVYKKFHGI